MISNNTGMLHAFENWCHWAGIPAALRPELGLALNSTLRSAINTRYSLLTNPASSYSTPQQIDNHVAPKADLLARDVAQSLGLEIKPFWPNQAPYALVITHDIDRIVSTLHALKYCRSSIRARLTQTARDITALIKKDFSKNSFFNFQHIQDFHKKYNSLAALYVLFEKRRLLKSIFELAPQHMLGVYQPKDISEQLRALSLAGHEIGLHFSFDSAKSAELIRHESRLLETITHTSPKGGRAHYLSQSYIALEKELNSSGFTYDSSCGFNFGCGFAAQTAFPFQYHSIYELPFQIMDSALRFSRNKNQDQRSLIDQTIKQVHEVGGALVTNFHLHRLNPIQFSNDYSNLVYIVEKAQRDRAWITRPIDLITHWSRRCS